MRALFLALAFLLLAAVPAQAAEVSETLQIPTKHGKVSVEIRRPAEGKVPIILTYSPYNVIFEGRETTDTYGNRYVPRGASTTAGSRSSSRASTSSRGTRERSPT